jgi:hypothetical protein
MVSGLDNIHATAFTFFYASFGGVIVVAAAARRSLVDFSRIIPLLKKNTTTIYMSNIETRSGI